MAGQGRPPNSTVSPSVRADGKRRARRLAPTALLLCLCFGSLATADEVDLRVRVTWGGGAPSAWVGTLSLSQGEMIPVANLGLEADACSQAISESPSRIQISQRSERAFDGFDIQLLAPADAKLTLRLTSRKDGKSGGTLETTVERLIGERLTKELDAGGCRMSMHRAPGDVLRIELPRDHLVYNAGERFQAEILPTYVDPSLGTGAKLHAWLTAVGSSDAVWQSETEVKFDARGMCESPWPLDFALPNQEGAYELVVELQTKRSGFVRSSKTVSERRVQLVTVAETATPAPTDLEAWQPVKEADSSQLKFWDRISKLPNRKLLGGNNTGPLGSEPVTTVVRNDVPWSALKPEGWQAYPLPVGKLGEPHLLEIAFPGDVPQTLGISIVEPNAAGRVQPVGVDGGIEVPPPTPGATPREERHRVVFWPRTKTPWLVLTNRRRDAAAIFGKVRVLTGPSRLPCNEPVVDAADPSGRLSIAYFERPFFAECFSGAEGFDAASNRSLDDWRMFQQGASRLADYLRYSGRNAAVVPAISEGSAIYPTQTVDATTQYDSGAYSESGVDPIRKDVLELLFRTFDREGLVLIPSIQFTMPLAELEQLKRNQTPAETEGIDLVGIEGRTWAETSGTRRGNAPYYNLLDERVQTAMRRTVKELTERYAKHPSFGGVAIQLSGNGYAQLPDETWGFDNATLTRFAFAANKRLPSHDLKHASERWTWLQREARSEWIKWRASVVSNFYATVQRDLTEDKPGAKLILCPVEPFAGRRMQAAVRPLLPKDDHVIESFLQTGIDAARLASLRGVYFARPTVEANVPNDSTNAEMNESMRLDALVAASRNPASLHLSLPRTLRLEAFEKLSPFGEKNTQAMFVSQISPVGQESRRNFIHAMAVSDPLIMLDGGWTLPLGQEEAIRPLFAVYRRLPAVPFNVVLADEETRTQPITFKTWSSDSETWVMLVNDSPWTAVVDTEFLSASSLALEMIGVEPTTTELPASQGVARWKMRLAPYDLVAAKIPRGHVKIGQWKTQVDQVVELAMREQLRDLRLRASALRAPQPLKTPFDESFERSSADGKTLNGWLTATGEGITIAADLTQGRTGTASLHVATHRSPTNGPAPVAWVRSKPFNPSSTGRIAVWAWLKVADAGKQPQLRMAIEGRLDGRPYYRRANVGLGEDGRSAQPLKEQWSPFLFPVDDLPAEGLTDLQVGFDLMDEGEVWIDDVQVYDVWFQEVERDALIKGIALADFQVQAGKVSDGAHFLGGYWPRFLIKHVPANPERVAVAPIVSAASAKPAAPAAKTEEVPKEPVSTGMLDRMKGWVPKVPTWR